MKVWTLGALSMAFAIAALFFLKFHRQTRDRLFAGFSIAFFVLAANQLAFAFIDDRSEAQTGLYVVRLVAFAMILGAIVDKNRSST